MLISQSVEINDSAEKVWNTIRSFDCVEKYLPIITKTTLVGKDKGATRICDVNIGSQIFQIRETIRDLDDSNHSLTTSLDDGPIQMRGMVFIFSVKSQGNTKSYLTISSSAGNPDAQNMTKNFFAMICQGVKKLHEI